MDCYNVVFASNDGGCLFLATALRSVIETAGEPERLRFWVLSDGISEAHAAQIRAQGAGVPGVEISLVDIRPQLDPHRELLASFGGRWPLVTWARLFIAEALPQLTGKALYLDTDTLVCEDVALLMEADLQGQTVGVVLENFRDAAHEETQFKPAKIPQTVRRYFNAGMLLFDLDAYRKGDCLERLLTYLRDERPTLLFLDQDASNAVLGDRSRALHARWNWPDRWDSRALRLPLGTKVWRTFSLLEMVEAALYPGVLHFWGRTRPWSSNHRPEGPRYAKVLYRTGMLERPLMPFGARVVRALYRPYHAFMFAMLRRRLAKLRAGLPEWLPEDAPPVRERPAQVLMADAEAAGRAPKTVEGVAFLWEAKAGERRPDWIVVRDRGIGEPPEPPAVGRPGRTLLVAAPGRRYKPAYLARFAAVLAGQSAPPVRHPWKFRLPEDTRGLAMHVLYAATRTPDQAIIEAARHGARRKRK